MTIAQPLSPPATPPVAEIRLAEPSKPKSLSHLTPAGSLQKATKPRGNELREMFLRIGVSPSAFVTKHGCGLGRCGRRFIRDNRHQLEWLLADAEECYRRKIVAMHPDRGGNADECASLTELMRELRKRVARIIDPREQHRIWSEVLQRKAALATVRSRERRRKLKLQKAA